MYPALELLHAGSGAIAIDLLLPHRDIDLVLLDYHLPDINGLEILRQMGQFTGGNRFTRDADHKGLVAKLVNIRRH